MKNKDTYSLVELALLEGKNKGEIFREFGGTDDFARTIAASPYSDDRKKYGKLNLVLVGIVVYFAAMKFFITSINFFQSELPIYIFPAFILIPAIALWIAVQLRKFRGSFYLTAGLFSIYVIFDGMRIFAGDFQQKDIVVWGIVHLPLAYGAYLAFFLKRRLCPFLGYMGAKTDSSGKYLFLLAEDVQPSAAVGRRD